MYYELKKIESKAIINIDNGELWEARENFLIIAELKEDYHNAYEILRELLNTSQLEIYNASTSEDKGKMLTEIKKTIHENYSWGLNKDDLEHLGIH